MLLGPITACIYQGGETGKYGKHYGGDELNIAVWSEIGGDELDIESKRKILTAVQRTAALRVASTYRTVSGAAVLVIVGEHLLTY